MGQNGMTFLVLGGALLLGFVAHVVGAKTRVPRVTLLLLLGVACGPAVFDVVPEQTASWFPFVAEGALAMVGFLLGEEFVYNRQQHSRKVLGLALAVTLVTAALVLVATWAVGAPAELALVLAGIATATAPAATLDLIREVRAKGPLTDAMQGIVASDDVLGVLLFSLLLSAAEGFAGVGRPGQEIVHALWEIGGALALGLAVGYPMAWLSGRLKPGEPAALEALGFVLLLAGLASYLKVSFLLAAMVLGGSVAHWAKHHTRAVHEIEGFSSPLLALFFFQAGFHLDVKRLTELGLLGATYVVARVLGRWLGSRFGPLLGHSRAVSRRIGWCLLPQAGVALGLGLLAARRLPDVAETVMTLVVAATVVFEITGPVVARVMLARAGELPAQPAQSASGSVVQRNDRD